MSQDTSRKCYGYRLLTVVIWSASIGVAVIFLLMFAAVPVYMIVSAFRDHFGYLFVFPFALMLLFGALLATAIPINIIPSICTTATHLEVKYYYVWWVKIRWEDVLEIRRSRAPGNDSWAVLVKGGPPLLYLFGWFHVGRLGRAIAFLPAIRECDDLLREIRRRSGAIITD